MKKLLGILVLGLLWCNVGFAEGAKYNYEIRSGILKFKLDDSKIVIHKEFSKQKTIRINAYVHVLEPTVIDDEYIKRHFNEANKVWKQANIFWNLKNIQRVKPGISFSKFKKFYKDYCKIPSLKKCFQVVYPNVLKKTTKMNDKFVNIKKHRKKDGVNIFYIPDNSVYYTIAALTVGDPGKNNLDNSWYIILPAKALSSRSDIKVEDPSSLTHELGHILNLRYNSGNIHSKDPKSLMNIGQSIGNKFANLSKKECRTARKNAKKIFKIK